MICSFTIQNEEDMVEDGNGEGFQDSTDRRKIALKQKDILQIKPRIIPRDSKETKMSSSRKTRVPFAKPLLSKSIGTITDRGKME